MVKAPHVSIEQTLQAKTILVVGGTGFIGKVWLALLLHTVPNMKRVHILCRKKGDKTARTIFQNLYRENPVFDRIREACRSSELPDVLNILEGDVCQNQLGLKDEIYHQLQKDVDLVVNFAADLRFDGPLDAMLATNVTGALRVGDFVQSAAKAKLLHISTCYVAGNNTGLIPEALDTLVTPSGRVFDPETEYAWAQQEIEVLRAREGVSSDFKDAARIRAQHLGWANSYTYTKSLAERLLVKKLPSAKITFFRPSIVETSLSFPFQGWNEDINGTVPLLYLLSRGQLFLVAKPEHYIDMIPVDLVARSLTLAAVALLRNEHKLVYQVASSSVNPISLKHAVHLSKCYQKGYAQRNFMQRLRGNIDVRFVSASGLLGIENLHRTEKFCHLLSSFAKTNVGRDFGLKRFASSVRNVALMMKTYKPFVHDLNYVFETQNISDYAKKIVEKDFWTDPVDISWEEYFLHTHLPGIERWCFPKLKAMFQRGR